MSLFFLIKPGGYKGVFDISSVDGSYLSLDANNQIVTGSLATTAAGAVTYTGDLFGNNENDRWWTVSYTPVGTWHTKLAFDTGTNQRSSGTELDTWTAVESFSMGFSKAADPDPGQTETVGNYTFSFSDDGGATTFDSVAVTITLRAQAA